MAKAQVSPAGDVAELVISAPPLNLFDGQLITDLETALGHLRGSLARVPAGNSGKLGGLDDCLGEDVLRCSRIAIRPGRFCARPRRPS